jgi:hypothetical protein
VTGTLGNHDRDRGVAGAPCSEELMLNRLGRLARATFVLSALTSASGCIDELPTTPNLICVRSDAADTLACPRLGPPERPPKT